MLSNLLGASREIPLEVGFPEPYDRPATGAHVGVLGVVERHPAPYPRLDAGALPVVPVVAVELDDDSVVGQPGVDTELPGKYRLWFVRDAQLGQKGVADPLSAGRAPQLLIRAHLEQHGVTLRVGIPAGQRAVSDF